MSQRVLCLQMLVYPDYGTFWVLDLVAQQTGDRAPSPPGPDLVSASVDALWIRCGQDNVQVTLVLEEWDGPPVRDDSQRGRTRPRSPCDCGASSGST